MNGGHARSCSTSLATPIVEPPRNALTRHLERILSNSGTLSATDIIHSSYLVLVDDHCVVGFPCFLQLGFVASFHERIHMMIDAMHRLDGIQTPQVSMPKTMTTRKEIRVTQRQNFMMLMNLTPMKVTREAVLQHHRWLCKALLKHHHPKMSRVPLKGLT